MAGIELPDWMRATALIGLDDPDYRVITVDKHGQLNVLLRGAYNDEIRTVTLDDEGRISAFVIDSADAWGRMLSVGNAELAVRLGSPVAYEQGGRVLLMETFENGLSRWGHGDNGGAAEFAIDPEYHVMGGYSGRLTTGAGLDMWSEITHDQGMLPKKGVGLAFCWSAAADFGMITASVEIWDGDTYYNPSFVLDGANDMLILYDDEPVPQLIATINPSTDGGQIFFFAKMVANLETGYYGPLRCNQKVYEEAAAYRFFTDEVEFWPFVRVTIRLTSATAGQDVIWLDNIILTAEEL